MPESAELTTVNPHYLERAIDLSESREVCASEDIYDAKGMKLLSKGALLAPGMQEKLIRHKLSKPLETTLAVADGVTIKMVADTSQQLLDEMAPLKSCMGHASTKTSPIDIISHISLNNSMTTLLTMAYNSEEQRNFKHSVLVCLISTILAIRAKLSGEEVITVAHAGLLHDIGEMYLAPEYLKSGAHLKPDEWKHVVVHPKVGQLVLQESTSYPTKVARAVGEHHERLDGSGYPHQIAGKQISREGAIVAAAETLGGIFMRPDNPLQRACLAMKIIPTEFSPEVVSVISSTAQSLSPDLTGESIKPLSDQAPRLHSLHRKLVNAVNQCEAIATSSLGQKKAVLETQQRVSNRIQVIKRSLTSSGIAACLLEPQMVIDDTQPEILLELEVISREMEWRLRDIARDLSLRLSSQDDTSRELFSSLIQTLDSPH